MFRLLNISAIWLLCQCGNHWLWNLPNYPAPALYFCALLHPTHPHARPRWVAGYASSWSVGGLKFPKLFRCTDSFSLVTRIPSNGQCSSLWAYLIRSFGRVTELLTMYVIFRPHLCGILFVNNHKTKPDREPRILLKNLPRPTANTKMETVTSPLLKLSSTTITFVTYDLLILWQMMHIAVNSNSRSHEKHSFADTLQSCHCIWFASKLHNAFTGRLSTIINWHNCTLNFTKHGESLGQHLIGNMRRQVSYLQSRSMCSKSDTQWATTKNVSIQGGTSILSMMARVLHTHVHSTKNFHPLFKSKFTSGRWGHNCYKHYTEITCN